MSSMIVLHADQLEVSAASGDARAHVELAGPGADSARTRVLVVGAGAAAVGSVLRRALDALAAAEADREALAAVRRAAEGRWPAPAGAAENDLRALAGDR